MILVTGGTGLLGAHLLFKLATAGYAVRATYRNSEKITVTEKVFSYYSKTPEILMDQIEWHEADINDLPALETAFHGITEVYHCAALVSFDPKDDKALLKTNVQGTENIVNLSIANTIEKLCFASSIAAIGPGIHGEMINEENEWSDVPTTTYALSKYLAEMKVWRASQEGIPVIIVNPGIIIGPGFWRKGSGSFFTFAAKAPKYFLPGGTGFVSVEDVVNSMYQLMQSSVQNQRFILVSKNLSFKKFSAILAKGLGKMPPLFELKKWMISLFWRWDWLRSKILGKRRRLSKTVARRLHLMEKYENSKLPNQLDFNYGDLEHTILQCCTIYLKDS